MTGTPPSAGRIEYPSATLIHFIGLLVFSIALALCPVPISALIGDPVANLEGAQRIVSGDTLFRDFHSPLGPWSFSGLVLFLRCGASGGGAFQLSAACWFFALGAISWWRIGRADGVLFRALVAWSVALLGFYPAVAGPAWNKLTYAGNYNCLSLALTIIVAIEITRAKKPEVPSPLVLGGVAGVLCLVKFTNLAVMPFVFLGLLFQPGSAWLRTAAQFLGAILAVALLAEALSPYSLSGYLADSIDLLRVATHTPGEKMRGVYRLREYTPLFLGMFGLLGWLAYRLGAPFWRPTARAFWLLLGSLMTAIALDFGSSVKVLILAPVLTAVVLIRILDSSTPHRVRDVVFGAAGTLLFLIGGTSVASGTYPLLWNLRYHGSTLPHELLGFRVVTPPAGVELPDRISDLTSAPENLYIADAYNDALSLARARVSRNEVLDTDDFTNVVVAAGLARGPAGDMIAWHWRRSFDERDVPVIERHLAEAHWVLTWRSPPTVNEEKARIFAAQLPTRFVQRHVSRYWILWEKAP